MRALGGSHRRRNTHAERRERRRHGAEPREGGEHLVPRCLERVHAQVDRRPLRHSAALHDGPLTEGVLKGRHDPVRNVGDDMRRRVRRNACRETALLLVAQRRGGMPASVARRDHVGHGKAERARRGRDREGARRIARHLRAKRQPPAQHVIDKSADRRPVAGAREAMPLAPILQRRRRRLVARKNVLEHLGRGLDAPTRSHISILARSQTAPG